MINHHDGAVEMVKDPRDYRGSAYDPVLNQFVSDLVNDQGVEIERMNFFLQAFQLIQEQVYRQVCIQLKKPF